MQRSVTISEYKNLFPQTSETPTLSQSGDLGYLLNQREKRLQREAEKQEKRERRRDAVNGTFRRIASTCHSFFA